MSDITNFFKLDFPSIFLSVFIIFAGIKAILSLLEWIANKFGIEFSWIRKKNEDHELLVSTAQALNALQEKHNTDIEQSIKHDKAIKEDLAIFMNEIREANKETQLEIKQFDENRIHDREQSFEIQKELTDSISRLATTGTTRDEQINSLVVAQKESLADRINQKYKYYLSINGIPEDEIDEFVSLHGAYNGVGGNHKGDAKFEYCMEHLPIIPVEVKLKLNNSDT